MFSAKETTSGASPLAPEAPALRLITGWRFVSLCGPRFFRACLLAVSQNLLVLCGKLAVAAGFDFALARKRRHVAQPFDRAPHFRTQRRIRSSGSTATVTVSSARSVRPPHAVTGRRRHHGVNRKGPRTRRKILHGSAFVIHVERACRRRWVRRRWLPVLIGLIGLRLRVGIRLRTIAVPVVILRPPVGRRSIVGIRPVVGVRRIVGRPPVVVISPVVVVRRIRRIVAYVVL